MELIPLSDEAACNGYRVPHARLQIAQEASVLKTNDLSVLNTPYKTWIFTNSKGASRVCDGKYDTARNRTHNPVPSQVRSDSARPQWWWCVTVTSNVITYVGVAAWVYSWTDLVRCQFPGVAKWVAAITTMESSIRFMGKPEGVQQCIFDLFWLFFGVQYKLGGLRGTRGGLNQLNPLPPTNWALMERQNKWHPRGRYLPKANLVVSPKSPSLRFKPRTLTMMGGIYTPPPHMSHGDPHNGLHASSIAHRGQTELLNGW